MLNSNALINKIDEILSIFSLAKEGDASKIEAVKTLVGVVSNPRSIRDMLRGTDAEIKRINEVFKMFLEFTNEHLMSFLHENSQETLDKSDNLLGMVSQFIKEYSQVLLVQYGLYQ